MDSLMSQVIVRAYSDMFVPGAEVSILAGHFEAAKRTIESLRDLHAGVRVTDIKTVEGVMRVGVDYGKYEIDNDTVDLDILFDVVVGGTHDQVRDILFTGRVLSAWSCAVDGRPGWIVASRKGMMPLCPECQEKQGLKVHRHEA